MKTTDESVGAFEAKTKLAELIERVRQGAQITITKRDRPVARLVPFELDQAAARAEATRALRELRQRYTLDGLDPRALRNAGRP